MFARVFWDQKRRHVPRWLEKTSIDHAVSIKVPVTSSIATSPGNAKTVTGNAVEGYSNGITVSAKIQQYPKSINNEPRTIDIHRLLAGGLNPNQSGGAPSHPCFNLARARIQSIRTAPGARPIRFATSSWDSPSMLRKRITSL